MSAGSLAKKGTTPGPSSSAGGHREKLELLRPHMSSSKLTAGSGTVPRVVYNTTAATSPSASAARSLMFPSLPEPRSTLPLTLSMVRQARLAADAGGHHRAVSPARSAVRGTAPNLGGREHDRTCTSFSVFSDTLRSFWANKSMMTQQFEDVQSSDIPHDYWRRDYSILRNHSPTKVPMATSGSTPALLDRKDDEEALSEYDELRKRFVTLMFPSTGLTNRNNSEALAHVLDTMLGEVLDPAAKTVVEQWNHRGAAPSAAGDATEHGPSKSPGRAQQTREAPTANEEAAPEVIQGTDNLSLVLSLMSYAPRQLDDESFFATQRTITSIVMIGWRELVRQVFGTSGDAGILLEKIRTTVGDLLDNANRAANYYKALYNDVVAMNLDRIIIEMGKDLVEANEKVQSLEHEIQAMQQELLEARQLRDEVVALRQREETYKAFMTRQLQRNALIMQMAVEGNPPVQAVTVASNGAMGKTPMGRANRLNSRVGMKRLNSTAGLGAVGFRDVPLGLDATVPGRAPFSPATSFRVDGGGNPFVTESSDPFVNTSNIAALGAMIGDAGSDDDDEEQEEIEMVDACVQANTDAGSDDKLHEACSEFFREIEKAATLSQSICKGFYGSGDFLNPSACCIHALELLGEISKRAMQLKERRVAAERAEQMLGQTKNTSSSPHAPGNGNPNSSPMLPKPEVEGLLSMSKAEHCKLLRDGATTAKELRLRLEALDSSEQFRRAVSYKAPKSSADPCSFCNRTELSKDALRAKDLLVIANDKNERLERERQTLTSQLDKLQKRLDHERAISQHRADEMEKVMLKRRNLTTTETQTDPVKTAITTLIPPDATPGTSELSLHSGRARNRRASTEVTFDVLKVGGGNQGSPNVTPQGGSSSRRSSRSGSTETAANSEGRSTGGGGGGAATSFGGSVPTKAQQYQAQLAAWLKDGWDHENDHNISSKLSPAFGIAPPAAPRTLQWCLGLIHTLFLYVPPPAVQNPQSPLGMTESGSFPTAGGASPVNVDLSMSCSQHLVDYLRQTYVASNMADETAAALLSGVAVFSHDPRVHLFSRFFLDEFSSAAYREFLGFNRALDRAVMTATASSPTLRLDLATSANTLPLHIVLVQIFAYFGQNNDRFVSSVDVCRELAVIAVSRSIVNTTSATVLESVAAEQQQQALEATGESDKKSSAAPALMSPADVPLLARNQYSVTLPDNWMTREIPRAAFLEELAGAIEKHLVSSSPRGGAGEYAAFMSSNATPVASALGYEVLAHTGTGKRRTTSRDSSPGSNAQASRDSSGGNSGKERKSSVTTTAAQGSNKPQVPKRPANSARVMSSTERSRRQTIR